MSSVAGAATLKFLTDWFVQRCDGEWEHDTGIRIATLDNPGWAIDIRIAETDLEGVTVDWVRADLTENRWLHWRSTGIMFEARCGAGDLEWALEAFREFASSSSAY